MHEPRTLPGDRAVLGLDGRATATASPATGGCGCRCARSRGWTPATLAAHRERAAPRVRARPIGAASVAGAHGRALRPARPARRASRRSHLTGERTLPDVPEENYWYRRHLVVYEWIARAGARPPRRRPRLRRGLRQRRARAHGGLRRRRRRQPRGVRARAAEVHAPAASAFERDMIETWTGDVDCVVFLQTIEHVQDPDAVLDRTPRPGRARAASPTSPRRTCSRSRPRAQERSGNPWHVKEYRPEEYRALCERHFAHVDLLGLFHARKLRAARAGASSTPAGTRVHAAARHHQAVLRPLHAGDLRARLRAAPRRARPRARPARRAAAMSRRARRARARPAHAHALRRGLRHVAVRRGVAVGGDRDAATCRCSTCSTPRRAGDAVGDAGARRPARGARRARRAAWRSCARSGRPRTR